MIEGMDLLPLMRIIQRKHLVQISKNMFDPQCVNTALCEHTGKELTGSIMLITNWNISSL